MYENGHDERDDMGSKMWPMENGQIGNLIIKYSCRIFGTFVVFMVIGVGV